MKFEITLQNKRRQNSARFSFFSQKVTRILIFLLLCTKLTFNYDTWLNVASCIILNRFCLIFTLVEATLALTTLYPNSTDLFSHTQRMTVCHVYISYFTSLRWKRTIITRKVLAATRGRPKEGSILERRDFVQRRWSRNFTIDILPLRPSSSTLVYFFDVLNHDSRASKRC